MTSRINSTLAEIQRIVVILPVLLHIDRLKLLLQKLFYMPFHRRRNFPRAAKGERTEPAHPLIP